MKYEATIHFELKDENVNLTRLQRSCEVGATRIHTRQRRADEAHRYCFARVPAVATVAAHCCLGRDAAVCCRVA